MEKWQVSYITRNISELISKTQCNTLLEAKLLEEGVLSENDIDILKTVKNSEGAIRQSYELYKILKTRKNAYNILLESLNLTNQTGAAQILSDGVPMDVRRSRRIARVFRRHVETSKPETSGEHYNAILRDLNGEPFSKVYLHDLRMVPKYCSLRYMNVFLPEDTDLKTILCNTKFPLYINTYNGSTLIVIFVKTGKTLTINVPSTISVKHLKFLICQKTESDLSTVRLLHAGRQLEDGRTLQDYNIQTESTLDKTHKLKGGMKLVDLESNQKSGIGLPAIRKWEGYGKGINPVGECLNKSCQTQKINNGETINRFGYHKLRLYQNKNKVPCSACKSPFIPENFLISCGRSLFRFKTQTCDEIQSVVLESLNGHENYKIFDPAEDSVEYDNIEIYTVPQKWSVKFCTFCEGAIKKDAEYIYECQHSSHKMCAENKGCCICEAKFISVEEFEILVQEQQLKLTLKNVRKRVNKRIITGEDETIAGGAPRPPKIDENERRFMRKISLKCFILTALLAVLASLCLLQNKVIMKVNK